MSFETSVLNMPTLITSVESDAFCERVDIRIKRVWKIHFTQQ